MATTKSRLKRVRTGSALPASSYERLADVFHHILSEQDLGSLLERIAESLADLVPYDTFSVYEAEEPLLRPVLAKDQYAENILSTDCYFGEGITGWAVEHREAVLANNVHRDARAVTIPGTPMEPESMISIPLIARDVVKGVLNIYRLGEDATFTKQEFEFAKRFGVAAALALDNAHARARLEHEAQTDSLTGLYNHRHFHERLRSELTRAGRARDTVTLMMVDLDDFKRINDVYGHGTGDQILQTVADMIRLSVRASDVPCRLGGEEFVVIMPSCSAGDAFGLASRLSERLAATSFDPAPDVTVSIGIAQGPEHAMNPRELLACAEAAMMTAKTRGKNRTVLFDDTTTERPAAMLGSTRRDDVRSIAHLKMLQSVAGKLNRLNSVQEIGQAITNELRTLIDYHNCRVYVAEQDVLWPVAFRGELEYYAEESPEALACQIGEGITGTVAATGKSLLIPNAMDCEFAITIPGTDDVDESMIVVPLTYGPRVVGVIAISKLGVDQFDEDDLRLLEVLAGQASVALENARLYEAQKRDAQNALALLESAHVMAAADTPTLLGEESVRMAVALTDADQSSLWLEAEISREISCSAQIGYTGDPNAARLSHIRFGRDVAGKLIGEKTKPFVLTSQELEDIFGPEARQADHTVAIAPLLRGNDLFGWIVVRQPTDGQIFFTEEKLRLLEGLAFQTSTAMQKQDLYKAQKESAEIASALLDFSRELASIEEMGEVLIRTVEYAAIVIGSPRTSLWIQDPAGDFLVPEALWGFDDDRRREMVDARLSLGELGPELYGSEPFILTTEDVEKLGARFESVGSLSYAVVPLKVDGERIGCLAVAAPVLGDHDFSKRKMRLLAGIANQAQVALGRASSFENLEKTFLSTVESLANALEAKDEYTSSHARSITDMSLEVGHALGIDPKELKRLHLGALFHDIGKIGIPSEILLKPGRLTAYERTIMQTHPELGEKILAPIERLADVRPIVRACHEHFDGSGYPDRKRGDEIPLESRIILVCDAYHAMTTDRPYRKRLSDREARKRLRNGAGAQFDPEIVDVFLRLLDEDPDFAANF